MKFHTIITSIALIYGGILASADVNPLRVLHNGDSWLITDKESLQKIYSLGTIKKKYTDPGLPMIVAMEQPVYYIQTQNKKTLMCIDIDMHYFEVGNKKYEIPEPQVEEISKILDHNGPSHSVTILPLKEKDKEIELQIHDMGTISRSNALIKSILGMKTVPREDALEMKSDSIALYRLNSGEKSITIAVSRKLADDGKNWYQIDDKQASDIASWAIEINKIRDFKP